MAVDDNLKKFLGQGIIFPLEVTQSGSVPIYTGVELIRSSIKIIVTWPKFTRYMLHEFGNQSTIVIEDPADRVSSQIIRAYTIDAISLWEKRVSLISVGTKLDNSTMSIGLKYKIRNTSIQDSFIFPFYEFPKY